MVGGPNPSSNTPMMNWYNGIDSMWGNAVKMVQKHGVWHQVETEQIQTWHGYSARLRKPERNFLMNSEFDFNYVYAVNLVWQALTTNLLWRENALAEVEEGLLAGDDVQLLSLNRGSSFFLNPAQGNLYGCVSIENTAVWGGLPYDMFIYSTVLNLLAEHHKMKAGFLHVMYGRMHMTNDEHSKAVDLHIPDREYVAPPFKAAAENVSLHEEVPRAVKDMKHPDRWKAWVGTRLGFLMGVRLMQDDHLAPVEDLIPREVYAQCLTNAVKHKRNYEASRKAEAK